jgi:4-amino-4-deoxy-L-arabinose transferase-like glycosyltransferase
MVVPETAPILRPEKHLPVSSAANRFPMGLWIILVVFLVTGAALTWFFLQPYPSARTFVDHFSRDGSMDSMTTGRFNALQLPGRVIGVGLLAAGLGLFLARKKVSRLFSAVVSPLTARVHLLPLDLQALWRDLARTSFTWLDGGLMIGLMLAAVLVRVLFLSRPISHDEAYTYIAFASRSWLALISDYHLPNNHIFHSILVKIATGLLGSQPWAVRTPAFLASVLSVPAGYLLAYRLYSRWTALLSSALIATLPVMILYGSNARGYAQYTLFTLLLFSLAVYLKSCCNLAGWLLFALIAALGFYTLPMMLYPLGGIMGWLLVSAFIEDPRLAYGSRLGFLKYEFAAGLLIVFLTGLFYLPVILWGTGWKSLAANPFVERLNFSDFYETFWSRMQDTRGEWMKDLPGWLGIFLSSGFVLSLLLHHSISRVKVSTQLVMFGWLAVVLLVQRPNPIVRIWTFLIPLFAIWTTSGWVELLSKIRLAPGRILNLGALLAVAGTVFLSGMAYQRTHFEFPAWQPAQGRVEQVVRFIQPRVQEGDIIVISSEDAPALWYYSGLFGISDPAFRELEKHLFPFKRAFVVVSQREGQTLESAIVERKLDPADFYLEKAANILNLDGLQVFECPMRP